MTDTRLPEQWLGDLTLDELTDAAFRVYINGLIWSVKYHKDGFVAQRALRLLHVDGPRPDLADELVRHGLWARDGEAGWQVVGFLEHQTSAADYSAQRESARVRARRYRDKQAAEKPTQDEEDSVTRDATRHLPSAVTRFVGQARAGKDRQGPTGATSPWAGSHADDSQSVSTSLDDEPWPVIRLCASCDGPMDLCLWEHGERVHATCVPASAP